MATEENEATIDETYAVRIPTRIRERVDLEPGDRIQWTVDEDDQLVASIVRKRHGVAAELDPIDMGETDAVDVTESYDWS